MQSPDLLTKKRLRHLEEMVAEITPAELQKKLEDGESFKLVEISSQAEFQQGHINGALHVELDELLDYADRHFRKFQQIVVYAPDASSGAAAAAAIKLQHAGFSNVLVLQGGKQAWKNSGYLLVD